MKKGEELGPLPDGLVTTKDDGIAAIEVEISSKKPGEMVAKLVRLVRKYEYRDAAYEPSFPSIWFYVLNEKIEDLVEAAAEDLSDDEQDRISVYVEGDLRASRFR